MDRLRHCLGVMHAWQLLKTAKTQGPAVHFHVLSKAQAQPTAVASPNLLERATDVIYPKEQRVRNFDDECAPKKETLCGAESLRLSPCKVEPAKKKPKEKREKKKFKSMWAIPGCELIKDCGLPIRYDVLYYRISDKSKRQYQTTWIECPKLLIKPKKVCEYDKLPVQQIRRRKLPFSPGTACKMVNPMPCKKDEKSICPRITMPCCKAARIPPTCTKTRVRIECKKPLAPYPSFSECKKDEFVQGPRKECNCLDQVFQFFG